MGKEKIGNTEIEDKFGFVIINGQPYKPKERSNTLKFEKVDIKKLDDTQRKAEEIADKLKESLDTRKVILEALTKIDDKDIDKMYKGIVQGKRKLKSKTRDRHCVDMQIGNFVLPIVS